MQRILSLAGAALVFALSAPLAAQDAQSPYWASIRKDDPVNMRVGPGEDYRILWVYQRQYLPMKVLRVKEGWRLVEDPDGARGWVVARFLTRDRTAIVKGRDPAAMRDAGNPNARLLWRLAPGVIGLLGDCQQGWCEIAVGPRRGFVEQARLWGAGEP